MYIYCFVVGGAYGGDGSDGGDDYGDGAYGGDGGDGGGAAIIIVRKAGIKIVGSVFCGQIATQFK